MIPTPDQVLPLLAPLAGAVPSAIRDGMDAADLLQPDPLVRDNHFWSHSARFYHRRSLATAQAESWQLIEGVPNTGIHIILENVHRIRVLKSLNGLVPHPGSNPTRRADWAQPAAQGEFFLSADNRLLVEEPDGVLPAMNLLIDWHQKRGEPAIFVSLPKAPWDYKDSIRVHWRRPFPTEPGGEFGSVGFNPPPVNDDFSTIVRIDPGEMDAG